MATQHGNFVWYELTASDPAASTAFYKTVLGWDERDAGLPGFAYTVVSANGAPVGGIMTTPPGGEASWTAYVAVDDVDAAAAKATELGGTVHRPPGDIPGVGRFAIVADPQGAAFAVFRGAGGDAPAVPPDTPGHPGWHELHARDWHAAWPFYQQLFGWNLLPDEVTGVDGGYRMFDAGAGPVGAMMTDGSGRNGARWLFYFTVDGLGEALMRIRSADGIVMAGPYQAPENHLIAHCKDSAGTAFALVSRAGKPT